MSITEILQSIQEKLVAPKNQYNSFGKYSYRNCEDILVAVKPLCAQYKAAVVLSDEVIQKGDRFYVKATATFHCGGETVSAYAEAREPISRKGMDEAQVTGATSSYARKYALNGLFAIDDNKDPDNAEPPGKGGQKPKNSGADNQITCSNCGKVINAVKKDGRVISAKEVANKCGGMCTKCFKTLKGNENGRV